MLLFFALCLVGVAIAGFSAFVIFWPLTLVHIRERHAELSAQWGEGAFLKPEALRWLLGRGFSLQQVQPPHADSDEALVPRMVQTLGARA